MRNFIYHNPTKIIFGENVLYKISAEIPANALIRLLSGRPLEFLKRLKKLLLPGG
jgi:alcohol dehydrogenase YqhD (iron-dependent ADH family)